MSSFEERSYPSRAGVPRNGFLYFALSNRVRYFHLYNPLLSVAYKQLKYLNELSRMYVFLLLSKHEFVLLFAVRKKKQVYRWASRIPV